MILIDYVQAIWIIFFSILLRLFMLVNDFRKTNVIKRFLNREVWSNWHRTSEFEVEKLFCPFYCPALVGTIVVCSMSLFVMVIISLNRGLSPSPHCLTHPPPIPPAPIRQKKGPQAMPGYSWTRHAVVRVAYNHRLFLVKPCKPPQTVIAKYAWMDMLCSFEYSDWL